MSFKQPLSRGLKIVLVLVAGVLFNGCARKPLPPVFNLYGYQRLAVVPFDNPTQDPALGRAAQDEMADEILSLGAVPVIDAKQVAAYLRSVGANASSIQTDPDLRNRVAKKFNCDLLLLGSAASYAEFLKDTAPQKVTNQSTGISKWGFYTYRKVVVDANAKLMDPATGSLIWSGKNKGWSWLNTWNPLPVPDDIAVQNGVNQFLNLANVVGRSAANRQVDQALDLANLVRYRVNHATDEEPAVVDETSQGSLVYPKSAAFADLRQQAIHQTMDGIVEDFRGHCGWTPQLRGNAN